MRILIISLLLLASCHPKPSCTDKCVNLLPKGSGKFSPYFRSQKRANYQQCLEKYCFNKKDSK